MHGLSLSANQRQPISWQDVYGVSPRMSFAQRGFYFAYYFPFFGFFSRVGKSPHAGHFREA